MISLRIPVSNCITGIYLRWWYNGYHYFNFTNGYEMSQRSESMDTQVTNYFSRISKTELTTRYKVTYSYQIVLEGITAGNIAGFEGLLLAEKVEQYEGGLWYEIEITRGDHVIREDNTYKLEFEITRRELPLSSSVLQKTLLLYIGSTLCDLDYDEVVPINKQVNDIAEMQDRQSDFTNTFRIRKTRRMRLLFELSGEVGATTLFPYQNQTCKLVQDGIEMISAGYMILDKSDDSYYYVTIYSGNLNFFKTIEPLKLINLTLATTNHDWTLVNMAGSHALDWDYVYPLCEPSDNGGITQLDPGVEIINIYGGWLPCFIKVKTIFEEIISNAGFICRGEILTNNIFTKLFMPISNRTVGQFDITSSKFWGYWYGWNIHVQTGRIYGFTPVVGTSYFGNTGYYITPYIALYKLMFTCRTSIGYPANVYIYSNDVQVAEMTRDMTYTGPLFVWQGEYTNTIEGEELSINTSGWQGATEFTWVMIDIIPQKISLGTPVKPRLNLPGLSQTDFIKTICNMFALIPEVDPRKREIYFWNYNDLYDNITFARDWSAYLSEREDEAEFKFGNYAQNNHLRYNESDDVIKENGDGIFQVNDETLPFEKEVVALPISTCDEVSLDPMFPGVEVSRLNINIYQPDTGGYIPNDTIDTRIVYVSALADASPPIQMLVIRDEVIFNTGNAVGIQNPKTARSLPVSFSQLMINYAGLSRLLTKTNLRRVKLNLPTYEVAGLKHYIPIYLSQYKSYFYVNKINNYIPGELCIVDLIKL
jgi:hypothetical protein